MSTADEVVRVELTDIEDAADAVRSHVIRTPILSGAPIGLPDGIDLWLKAENLQRLGVFKVRGATNAILKLSAEERSRGVITVSAGNHGLALTFAASQFGSRAVVVMPEGATQAKVAAVEEYGGEAVLVDGTKLMENMREIVDRDGLTFIHPFDHPDVIAGQGTVGLEIIEDIPDVDMVVVPVGGGGLISGIATAIKGRKRSTVVIGVEPEGSAAVSASLAAGEPVALEQFRTVADGLNAPWGGPNTFAAISRLVDSVITVTEEEILNGLRAIAGRAKLVVEPAGAAAVAALIAGKTPSPAGKKVVAILSGGNVDQSRFARFLGSGEEQ
jgi:threonine dehydratase